MRFREFGAIFGTYQNPPCWKQWGFLLKIDQFRTLANSPEIHTNNPPSTFKSIYNHVGGVSGSLERFTTLTKIRHVQNHGQAFCSRSANFEPFRIHPKSTRTISETVRNHLQAYRRHFREFGTIYGTYQNPPCSKAWAIAQGFCSTSSNFGPLRIHPKSTRTIPQAFRNPFASMLEAFQGVWSDFRHLPKSAMLKTMGLLA